jgi:hypothetical protein
MSKLCSVCGTENRDEAQFCRACGTAFSAAKVAAAAAADGSAANTCAECGFQNKPGIRYCANCGMSLAAGAADTSGETAAPSADEPYAGGSPPPITYQSFATVSPYPTVQDTDHSALFDEQPTPDIPDPDAAIALRQQEGYGSHGDTAVTFQNPPAPNRAPLILGIVLAVLAVAGIAAWLFMGSSNPAPPVVAPGPTSVTPPVAATPTPEPTKAPPIIVEEAPQANAASAATPASAAVPPPPTAAVPLGTPPAAAAPLPQLGDPAVESADAEAKRVAAEKQKAKAAKDKAERDAKAKTAAEQTSPTAAQRAEQEAAAKRRAEETQRAPRPSTAATPSPSPGPATQARGVKEICAGRGTIAEAVCQSRQCGLPEHANEQICRQLRDADERRRNMQN